VGAWLIWEVGPRLDRGSPLPVISCFVLAGALFVGCLLVAQPLASPFG
jgi:hypothetical protein